MGVLKKKLNKEFTQVPNKATEDNEISDGAFRLYVYLLSRPDNWDINNKQLKNTLNIKANETIAKYFKELINSGWIYRTAKVDEHGKYKGGFDYEIYNEKQIFSNSEKSLIRKNSKLENSPKHNNIDSNNNIDINNNTENEKLENFSASIHELYAKVIEKFEAEEIPATKAQKRKWLETLEKLQRLDGRSEEEILNVISWLKNHDFWAGNFHSILKLRRKDKDGTQFFKRFIAEMKKEKSSGKKEKIQLDKDSDY